MKLPRMHVVLATVGVAASGTLAAAALGSPPSLFTGEPPLVTATLPNPVRASSDDIKFRTKDSTDVRMQKVVIGAGGSSGWHHHPGMVIVAVASGAVDFADENCHSERYGPGQPNGSAFVESEHGAQQASSEGGATVYVTYVAPSSVPPVFRVEEDPPPCAVAPSP